MRTWKASLGLRPGEILERLPIRAAPNPQNTVLAARHDDFAVGSCSRRIDIISGPTESADVLAVFADQSNLIITGTGQRLIGGVAKSDGGALFPKAVDIFLPFAGDEIPDFNNIICAAAGQGASITFPTHSYHMMEMAFKRFYHLASRHFDHLHKPVRRA